MKINVNQLYSPSMDLDLWLDVASKYIKYPKVLMILLTEDILHRCEMDNLRESPIVARVS